MEAKLEIAYFLNITFPRIAIVLHPIFLGVENSAGPSRDSAILEVERREKPQIEVYPSDNQTVVQGGSVLIQCRILSGIPNPQVSWKSLSNANAMFEKNVEILANGGVIRITNVQKRFFLSNEK